MEGEEGERTKVKDLVSDNSYECGVTLMSCNVISYVYDSCITKVHVMSTMKRCVMRLVASL